MTETQEMAKRELGKRLGEVSFHHNDILSLLDTKRIQRSDNKLYPRHEALVFVKIEKDKATFIVTDSQRMGIKVFDIANSMEMFMKPSIKGETARWHEFAVLGLDLFTFITKYKKEIKKQWAVTMVLYENAIQFGKDITIYKEDCKFIDYLRVIPAHNKEDSGYHSFAMSLSVLPVIKRVADYYESSEEKSSHSLLVHIKAGQNTLDAELTETDISLYNSKYQSYTSKLSVTLPLEDAPPQSLDVYVNPTFLYDGLKLMNSRFVTIYYKDPEHALVLESDALYVFMPCLKE